MLDGQCLRISHVHQVRRVIDYASLRGHANWSEGSYCPYACPAGQLMAQWDPKATKYAYPESMV